MHEKDHKLLKEMVELFKALGDPNRLKIIRLLASKMENSITVTNIANKLDISQPAASQHLKILKNIGILEPNKKGNYVYYNINTDVLFDYRTKFDMLLEIAFEKCYNMLKHKDEKNQ